MTWSQVLKSQKHWPQSPPVPCYGAWGKSPDISAPSSPDCKVGTDLPGGSVPSATSDRCSPNPGHTYHLPGLLELGVEALQLLGHLPRRPEGPAGPGEGAPAVGAAGRAVVSRAELTRAGSWGAGGLPGAPTELWREGGIQEGTHGSSITSPIPRPGNKQPDISMATGHQKLVSLATAEHTREGTRVRMGWGAG